MAFGFEPARILQKSQWDITRDTWGVGRKFWPLPGANTAPAQFSNCYFSVDGLLVAVDYSNRVCFAPKTVDRENFLEIALGYQRLESSLFSIKIPKRPWPWE